MDHAAFDFKLRPDGDQAGSELLTVAASRILNHDGEKADQILQPPSTTEISKVSTPEDALNLLQSKPSIERLKACLVYLKESAEKTGSFNVRVPSAKAAQIIGVLVSEICPSFWPVLHDQPDVRRLLLICLRSVAGIGALASQIKSSSLEAQGPIPKTAAAEIDAKLYLDVLQNVIEGSRLLPSLQEDAQCLGQSAAAQAFLWKEVISWLASGKLLSIAAEGVASLKDVSLAAVESFWVADGRLYAKWLGDNLRATIVDADTTTDRGQIARFYSKALQLGHGRESRRDPKAFLLSLNGSEQLCGSVFLADAATTAETQSINLFTGALAQHEQRKTLFTVLQALASLLVSSGSNEALKETIREIGGYLKAFVSDRPALVQGLVDSLTGDDGASIVQVLDLSRSIVACLDEASAQKALSRLLSRFGEPLYIQHAPMLEQEACTRIILLCAGKVWRRAPADLKSQIKTSLYLNAISNRVAATSPRAQLLGMVVGLTFSKLTDEPSQQLKFDTPALDDENIKALRRLIDIDANLHIQALPLQAPRISSSNSLRSPTTTRTARDGDKAEPERDTQKNVKTKPSIGADLQDDLPRYAKPDSDPEDEDDDPAVVERNKPVPPVYIRDLLAGLHDAENFERHRLALESAADLIRRKKSFGTEVLDHTEQLAATIVGLKDSFDIANFQELRLEAMLAIISAKPLQMAQWFANTLFVGDYSISQRVSILTAVGLAAQELAGHKEEVSRVMGRASLEPSDFPTKRLPPALERVYATDAAPLRRLARGMELSMLRPMAAEAADQVTGPNVLKVRTFSSRMEVEKKRKKPITNELAKIVADGFIFPLSGRWRAQKQTLGSRSAFSTPFLQAHFLRSISIILSASGPSTLSLPALTTEIWDLCLDMRTAATEPPVLEALLFAFLTLLQINQNQQQDLVRDHAHDLLETQAWVERVFETVRGGTEEEDKVHLLAAGVLGQTQEITNKYQRMLIGELGDFMRS